MTRGNIIRTDLFTSQRDRMASLEIAHAQVELPVGDEPMGCFGVVEALAKLVIGGLIVGILLYAWLAGPVEFGGVR